MRFISNAHTHSTWCDGKNTLEEMAEAAVKRGFTDLGFTCHSPISFDPGCPGVQDEGSYQRALRRLAERYEGQLKISAGLEWDYFSPEPISGYDYLIGSVHYFQPRDGNYKGVDESPETLRWVFENWFDNDFVAMAQEYYELVVTHITAHRPKIVGHFDLIMKFNDQLSYLTEENREAYQKVALAALDQVIDVTKSYGGLVEVNTGGISRGWTKAPYPAPFLLEHLLQRQQPIILTSDSHAIDTLDYYFDEALALVKQVGFTKLTQLQDGTFQEVIISE